MCSRLIDLQVVHCQSKERNAMGMSAQAEEKECMLIKLNCVVLNFLLFYGVEPHLAPPQMNT